MERNHLLEQLKREILKDIPKTKLLKVVEDNGILSVIDPASPDIKIPITEYTQLNTSVLQEGDEVYATKIGNDTILMASTSSYQAEINVPINPETHIHTYTDLSIEGTLTVGKLVNGTEENGLIIENGNLDLKGTATVFDDMVFPLTTGMVGALNKPVFDYDNNAYLFPQNDASERIYLIGQMSHSWKTGSMIYPHIHWLQTASTTVGWKLDYKIFDNGTTPPATWTTIALDTPVIQYTSGSMAQISKSSNGIDCSSITGISAMFLGKIYRDDNITDGNVSCWQFDIHYEKDSLGTNAEYV